MINGWLSNRLISTLKGVTARGDFISCAAGLQTPNCFKLICAILQLSLPCADLRNACLHAAMLNLITFLRSHMNVFTMMAHKCVFSSSLIPLVDLFKNWLNSTFSSMLWDFDPLLNACTSAEKGLLFYLRTKGPFYTITLKYFCCFNAYRAVSIFLYCISVNIQQCSWHSWNVKPRVSVTCMDS